MREREAVADLHLVLIEALRAVLSLCGLSGTVDGEPVRQAIAETGGN